MNLQEVSTEFKWMAAWTEEHNNFLSFLYGIDLWWVELISKKTLFNL